MSARLLSRYADDPKVVTFIVVSLIAVAMWLATWNTTFLLFAVLIVPMMLQPGDTWVHWALEAEGAGNDLHVAVEGLAFPMIGFPTLLFFWVLWRLRNEH